MCFSSTLVMTQGRAQFSFFEAAVPLTQYTRTAFPGLGSYLAAAESRERRGSSGLNLAVVKDISDLAVCRALNSFLLLRCLHIHRTKDWNRSVNQKQENNSLWSHSVISRFNCGSKSDFWISSGMICHSRIRNLSQQARGNSPTLPVNNGFQLPLSLLQFHKNRKHCSRGLS